MRFHLVHFESLDSTNREAADQARRGAAEGLTIVADEQTAGRGRQGRSWISQKGSGAYFSIILRPRIDPRHYTLVPLMAAIAVCDALREGWPIRPDIKWPNDVVVGDRKICGILSEMIDTAEGNAIILGIGINVHHVEAQLNATSIEAETDPSADRDDVVEKVLAQLRDLYQMLQDRPLAIIDEWSKRSSYFSEAQVNVDLGNGDAYTGTTCGLEESGALRVRVDDGSVRIVQAGDVTRLRKV